jgi:hypothetical protein
MFGMSYNNRDQWRDLVRVRPPTSTARKWCRTTASDLPLIKEQGGSIGYDVHQPGRHGDGNCT